MTTAEQLGTIYQFILSSIRIMTLNDFSGDKLAVAGTITNTGQEGIVVGANADEAQIGGRVYAAWDHEDATRQFASTPLFEVRGVLSADALAAGEQAEFRIAIPAATLEDGLYLVVIDMVVEHQFWFADYGQTAYRLHVLKCDGELTGRLPLPAETVSMHEGLLLGAPPVLAQAGRRVRRLLNPGRQFVEWRGADMPTVLPRSIATCPSARYDGIFDDVAATHSGVPFSRLMMHLTWLYRLDNQFDLNTLQGALQVVKWFLFDAPTELQLDQLPVSAELASFLGSDAVYSGLLAGKVSILTFFVAIGASRPLDLCSQNSLDELAFWWVGDFRKFELIHDSGIPLELEEILSSYQPKSTKDTIPANPFFTRFLLCNDEYGSHFDPGVESDRIALAFILLYRFLGTRLGRILHEGLDPFFSETIDPNILAISRFEGLFWFACGELSLSARTDLEALGPTVGRWFGDIVCSIRPALIPYSSYKKHSPAAVDDAESQVFVIGLLSSSSGIGQNGRTGAAILQRLGLPVLTVDTENGLRCIRNPDGADTTMGRLVRDITVFHLPPENLPETLLRLANERIAGSYRIGYFLWELDVVPRCHELALDLVDEIWVPSEFVKEIYRNATTKAIHVMPKMVCAISTGAEANRNSPIFRFLVAFDAKSGVPRKNPGAALLAFQRAFPNNSDVALILKVTGNFTAPQSDPHGMWNEVTRIAAEDPRISVVQSTFTEEQFHSLLRSVDCVVSAHRAEGFGYIPAYALAYGIPIICTDYSGTTEFCNEATGFPVRYSMKLVKPGEFLYDLPGARWADVDVDDLALRMQEVVRDLEGAKARAACGRQLIDDKYSMPSCTVAYKRRLLAAGLLDPA